ncbi:hypothetical protein PR202_ga10537 [Eleusine coracana subsp. coracana]|uniref:protein-serine/threonine phosphatase n=1 Tax=Eleusine coracana subsp. coracana TaxID=191504 RepID=A0AAV5C6Z2_ELECO|nr:hypothetical protein PR202_ga10537 [Eleusine coracana subsp. coracana]
MHVCSCMISFAVGTLNAQICPIEVLGPLKLVNVLVLLAEVSVALSTKRRRVEEPQQDQEKTVTPGKDTAGSSNNVQVEICLHPGYFGGLCFRCGKPQAEEDVSGVAFGYIHKRHQKGLDVILGAESVAVILDDTEFVWQKHKENLILMERYHYFASSCEQFGHGVRSLSESMLDERESDGALATILDVLKRIHTIFFDSDVGTDLSSRDVRPVIKAVRKEVLQGCKLVFTRVFPQKARPQDQFIWKMAEQLGAVCCADVDSTVTHVVALDPGTDKAHWAAANKKFLVHPQWIEAANFRWKRQPEEDFPVPPPKGEGKESAVASHHKETGKGKETTATGDKETGQGGDNTAAGNKETGQGVDNTAAGQEKAQDGQETALGTTAAGPTDS